MDQNYLIVVHIVEGRHFPSRANCSLVIEAKFNGEVMATDPFPHTYNPNFNTELAWGVDRKSLHLHRLQRTPIKVQCFSVESNSNKKECIGYSVLDLRTAQEKSAGMKWVPLLNSKYHSMKPEICLSMHLEKDDVPTTENPSEVNPQVINQAKPRLLESNESVSGAAKASLHKRSPRKIEEDAINLTPRLNLKEGLYEIGPEGMCLDKFVFSVTVSFAANLIQLLPTDAKLSRKKFHFLYELLGNEITTEPFGNITDPKFPAERASLRINSSQQVLKRFFLTQPDLQMYLCTGDKIIGEAAIPIKTIFGTSASKVIKFPATLEGVFKLHPVPSDPEIAMKITHGLDPIVGVSIVIQQGENTLAAPEAATDSDSSVFNEYHEDTQPSVNNRANHRQDCSSPPRASKNTTESVKRQLGFSPPQKLDKKENLNDQRRFRNYASTRPSSAPLSSVGIPGFKKTEDLYRSIDDVHSFHHFCFTLDLRSLHLYPSAQPLNCFLRYDYAFFGSSSPVTTSPPVKVVPDSDVTFSNGYCSFNFATSPMVLVKTFAEVPLIVEIVNKTDRGDSVYAVAKIELNAVNEASATAFMDEQGKIGHRKITTCKVSVASSNSQIVGELLAIMSLDDKGSSPLPETTFKQDFQTKQLDNPGKGDSSVGNQLMKMTEQEILDALKELEVWKEQQEIIFRKKLKEKESEHLQTLTEEWRQHDMEREMMTQRKMKECQELEEKLKTALRDIENREQELSKKEMEITRQKSDLQYLKDRLQKETKETIRRSLAEYEHLLEMEKKKVLDLENEKKKFKEQVSDLEKKLKETERSRENLKNHGSGGTFVSDLKLRAEVDVLLNEKSELLRKFEETLQLKQHYKEKWSEAVHQLQLCQQKIVNLEQSEFTRKERELAELYKRTLARHTQQTRQLDVVPSSTGSTQNLHRVAPGPPDFSAQEFTSFNDILQRQNTAELDESITTSHSAQTSERLVVGGSKTGNDAWSEHIQRLVEERDTLLKTGVYNSGDKIILELEKHINDALRRGGKM